MMKARVWAAGVRARHPSHSLAPPFVWQPETAKSPAKSGIIQIADLGIGFIPFAEEFDGPLE